MNPYKKIKKIKKALKVSDSKNLGRILYEFLIYKVTKPDLAEQYFSKYLFRKSVADPSDYIVTHKSAERVWYYNDMNYKFIFTNKIIAELFFSQNNIPVLRSFTYNIDKMFFHDGELTLINNVDEFRSYLLTMKEQGLWKEDYMIVKKKDDSFGGRNIFKIAFTEVRENTSSLKSLYDNVVNSGYLFQNLVIQHSELNKVNPNALNTLRIDSFTNNEGISKILNTTLRFSCGDSFTDNVTGGGMFIGIKKDSGVLQDEAFSNFDTGTGDVLPSHPLTGLVFKDFQIPFFQEAKQIALDAASLLPRARVIGWDIGISSNGPVLIEGNYFNGLYPFELGQKGHKNNSVFQELLNELLIYYNKEGNDLEELKKKYPLFK